MTIEIKHYKRRDKRKPRPEDNRPKAYKRHGKWYYKTKEGPTVGPFANWGEAEISRRAYWKETKQ